MKKRAIQLVFYIVYCLLALVGFLLDFNIPAGKLTGRPFVFYTSLSNMCCSVFIFAALFHRIRRRTGDFCPRGKFVLVVMILVTAIVYNLLLNTHDSWQEYFASAKNALYHLILPVLFCLDWFLFYRRGTVKPSYPLLAVFGPALYVVYILIRAAIVTSADIPVSILYPYFFLNLDRLGWNGFSLWMAILLPALLALGYTLYALDRLLGRKAALPV